MDQHGNELRAFFQKLADAIENLPWARWFEELKAFSNRVDEIVKSTVGWEALLKALVAIKLLDWLTPTAVQFGLIAAAIAAITGNGPALTALFAARGVLAAGGALAATVSAACQRRRGRASAPGTVWAGRPRGARLGPSGATPAPLAPPPSGATPAAGAETATGTAGVPGGGARGAGPGGARTTMTGGGGATPANVEVPKGAAPAAPGTAGQYRPVYSLTPADTSADVINTIAGEARVNNQRSVDAVINNMLNRVGTTGYGPSGNLREVARAPKQYKGYRQANEREAEYIKSRIRAIASGAVPDITGGANEFRADWYSGLWYQRLPNAPDIGGNRFARNPRSTGTYAPYEQPKTGVQMPGPQSFLPPNIGAAMAANIANHNSTVNNNRYASHEVNIANMSINTSATDASGLARDIRPALERASQAMIGNYSLA